MSTQSQTSLSLPPPQANSVVTSETNPPPPPPPAQLTNEHSVIANGTTAVNTNAGQEGKIM